MGQNTPVECNVETWLCDAFWGARGLLLKRVGSRIRAICVEAIACRKHASSAGERTYARKFVRFRTTDVGWSKVAARRPAIVAVKLFYFGG